MGVGKGGVVVVVRPGLEGEEGEEEEGREEQRRRSSKTSPPGADRAADTPHLQLSPPPIFFPIVFIRLLG